MKTSWITPGPGDVNHQTEEPSPLQTITIGQAYLWGQRTQTVQIHGVLRGNLKDMWKHFTRIEHSKDGERNFTGPC